VQYSTFTENGKKSQVELIKQIAENKTLLATSTITSVGGGAVANSNNEIVNQVIQTCAAATPTWLDTIAANVPTIGLFFLGIQTFSVVFSKYLEWKQHKKIMNEKSTDKDHTS